MAAAGPGLRVALEEIWQAEIPLQEKRRIAARVAAAFVVSPPREAMVDLAELQADWIQYERGCIPKPIELLIIVWVQALNTGLH